MTPLSETPESAMLQPPTLVAPTESAKTAVSHYASDFLSEYGIVVSPTPEDGQTVVLYAHNAQAVQDSLRTYEGFPKIFVMTRATRHEADTILRQQPDVTVETVRE